MLFLCFGVQDCLIFVVKRTIDIPQNGNSCHNLQCYNQELNNINLVLRVLGTFVIYGRNFPHVNFLPLWRKTMCSLLESNLCYGQRMSPLNCSVLQIIFYELRI